MCLSGTVVSQEGGTVTIKSGAKQVKAHRAGDTACDGRARSRSRCDAITFDLSRAASPADAPGVNAVIGRVSAIEYQGTWLKITIEEACSEEFVANVPDNVFFADPLKVGDAVLAQWDAKEVHFLDGYARRACVPSSHAAAAASVASA